MKARKALPRRRRKPLGPAGFKSVSWRLRLMIHADVVRQYPSLQTGTEAEIGAVLLEVMRNARSVGVKVSPSRPVYELEVYSKVYQPLADERHASRVQPLPRRGKT